MTVPVPFPPFSWLLVGYACAAMVMVSFDVWVFLEFFRNRNGLPTLSRGILTAYVLISSVTLWVSVLYDAMTGDTSLGITAILFGVQIMMIAPFAWAFVAILRADQYFVDRRSWGWPLLLAVVMLGNELMMGAVWVALSGGAGALYTPGPWAGATVLELSVATVWFFWSMSANMVPLVAWVKTSRAERIAFLGLVASGVAGPWVFASALEGAVAMGAVMTATFLLVLRELSRGRASSPGPFPERTLLAVASAFGAMLVGEVVLATFPTAPWGALPYSLVMIATMLGEMLYLTRHLLADLPSSVEEVSTASPIAEPVPAS